MGFIVNVQLIIAKIPKATALTIQALISPAAAGQALANSQPQDLKLRFLIPSLPLGVRETFKLFNKR